MQPATPLPQLFEGAGSLLRHIEDELEILTDTELIANLRQCTHNQHRGQADVDDKNYYLNLALVRLHQLTQESISQL